MEGMAEIFSLKQLEYGIRGGVEAAVHATRIFLQNKNPPKSHCKTILSERFNSIHRDRMLSAVQNLAPKIFPLVHSAYSSSSSFFWGDRILMSSEGVQQRDTLGPLLFSLSAPSLPLSCRQSCVFVT